MRSSYRTALFASLLALVCAGVLWTAYDWFQGRYLRTFSEHTAVFPATRYACRIISPDLARFAWCISGTRPAPATSAISST